RWTPIGKSGAFRCGCLIITADPADPTRFYVDDDRTSERFLFADIPLEHVGGHAADCADGVSYVRSLLDVALHDHDVVHGPIPATGLDVWYDLASDRAREVWEQRLADEAAEDEHAEAKAHELIAEDVVDLSTVTPKHISYVWGAPRIPRGKLTLL